MKFTKFKTDLLMRNLRQMVNDGIIEPLQTPAWRDTLKQWEVLDRWDDAKRPFFRCHEDFIAKARSLKLPLAWKPDLPIDPIAIELPATFEYYNESITKRGLPYGSDKVRRELIRLRSALLFKEEGTISAITYNSTPDGKDTNAYYFNVFQFDDKKRIHVLGAIAIGMAALKNIRIAYYTKEDM